MTVALIVITSADHKRALLIDDYILPLARTQGFDDILVVGDHHEGPGYRYLPVPPLTRTTVDALVKRDVGALATGADVLFYVADDHVPKVGDMGWLHLDGSPGDENWDVFTPLRFTERDGKVITLSNGEHAGYCAGHGIVIKRWVVKARPWSTMPHVPTWDVEASRVQQALGAKFAQIAGIEVWDHEWRINPASIPWQ